MNQNDNPRPFVNTVMVVFGMLGTAAAMKDGRVPPHVMIRAVNLLGNALARETGITDEVALTEKAMMAANDFLRDDLPPQVVRLLDMLKQTQNNTPPRSPRDIIDDLLNNRD